MSKDELQRMHKNARVKIWKLADQRISLKLEMAELRALSDKAVLDSGDLGLFYCVSRTSKSE